MISLLWTVDCGLWVASTMIPLPSLFLVFLYLPLTLAADYEVTIDAPFARIAFGSCHKNTKAQPTIWNSILALQPHLWLWTGDAVYAPMRKVAPVQVLREEYAQLLNYEPYQRLHHAVPTFGTWDDHDYGGNDMGDGMPNKEARADAFFDFLGQTRRPDRAGVYHSLRVHVGNVTNVRVLFLDTRWHRQEHCIPSVATWFPLGAGIACVSRWLSAGLWPALCRGGSILGAEQWSWLERELESSSDVVNQTIVVSSIQVLTTNPAMESWGQYPEERERLVKLLHKHSALILSGDVHHAEVSQAGGLTEVTSSGLTHTCRNAIYGPVCTPLLETFRSHRRSRDDYFLERNFGTIDLWADERRFQVNVHNEEGSIVLTTERQPLGSTMDAPSSLPECMDGHLQRPTMIVALFVFALFILVRRRIGKSKTE